MSAFKRYDHNLAVSRALIRKAAEGLIVGHFYEITGKYGCRIVGTNGRHIRNLYERNCILCGISELFIGEHYMHLHHIVRNNLHGNAQPWWMTLVCRECHHMIHREEQHGFLDMMCLLKAFEYGYEEERVVKRGTPDVSLEEALEPDIIFEMSF